MMVMTAKVNMKKVMMALAAVAAVILALILLLDGNKEAKPETSQTTGASQPSAGSNDSRVQFLKDYGWEVTPSPTESSQVKIPTESSPVFESVRREECDALCLPHQQPARGHRRCVRNAAGV